MILPQGMAVELIEASRQGTADYASLYKAMNDSIARVITGHTATSETTPGRMGGENLAQSTFDDTVKAEADSVCESFNRGPAVWMTQWNYPGAKPPKIWRRTENPTDWVDKSTAVANLAKAGYRPGIKSMQQVFGDDIVDVGMETVKTPQPAAATGAALPAPAPAGAAFAEGDPSPTLTARLEQLAQGEVQTWIAQIRKIVQEESSLPDISRRLAAEFSELDSTQFAALMAEAMTVANLQGRAEVRDGS